MMYGGIIDTATLPVAPYSMPISNYHKEVEGKTREVAKWKVLAIRSDYDNTDIDWYRVKHGKDEGERRFHLDYPEPSKINYFDGNMVLGKGVAALWAYALGLGTSSANTALQGATYFNNANTYLGVGDAGVSAQNGGSATVSITNGGYTLTFSSSQSGLQGKYFVSSADSTGGLYLITSGSGTSWTINNGTGVAYGGTTLSTSSAWSVFQSETHSQTGLSGSSNTYLQAADGGYPTNPYSAQMNAISAATAASPSVLTVSGADISTNDICQVLEVQGMTGVNGIFVANPASSSSITLLNSTGTGTFNSGFGLVTKQTVFTVQATFGASSANFGTGWWEWALYNGNSSNKIALNRKCANLGVKSSGGTTALKVGIGIG